MNGAGRSAALVLAAVVAGCRAAPPTAGGLAGAPAVPSAPAEVGGLPLDACGLYDDGQGDFVGLAHVGGQPVLLIPPRELFPIRPERATAGLRIPLPPTALDGGTLPPSLALVAPAAGEARWRLGTMQQWRDPVAARLLNAARTRRLVRLEDKRIRAIVEIRRDARLVRERPAPELREIANSIDPQLLQTLGGPIGLSLNALGSRLDDLERAVAPSERARFAGYRHAVDRSVNPPAPFWPRADDEFLLELAARRWPPREEIVLRDGAVVASRSTAAGQGPDCFVGLLLPEPAEDRSHPPAASVAPAAGKLGAVSVLFVVLERGPPDGCLQAPTVTAPRDLLRSFPLRLFEDARGRLVGAQVTGYMSSELYVAGDLSEGELETLLREQETELARQAE